MTGRPPRIEVEDDRVIMRGDWAEEVIHDVTFSLTENIDEFNGLFEIVKGDHVANEDYYQGMSMVALIRRRSDGRLFGYEYWQGGGEYGESLVETNGEDHGLGVDYADCWSEEEYEAAGQDEAYVWLPAEPYPVQYWRVKK